MLCPLLLLLLISLDGGMSRSGDPPPPPPPTTSGQNCGDRGNEETHQLCQTTIDNRAQEIIDDGQIVDELLKNCLETHCCKDKSIIQNKLGPGGTEIIDILFQEETRCVKVGLTDALQLSFFG